MNAGCAPIVWMDKSSEGAGLLPACRRLAQDFVEPLRGSLFLAPLVR